MVRPVRCIQSTAWSRWRRHRARSSHRLRRRRIIGAAGVVVHGAASPERDVVEGATFAADQRVIAAAGVVVHGSGVAGEAEAAPRVVGAVLIVR